MQYLKSFLLLLTFNVEYYLLHYKYLINNKLYIVIISALKSNDSKDNRSPIHLDTIGALLSLEAKIMFEKNIGDGIFTTNEQFKKAGLEESERNECLQNSDLIISNQPLQEEELNLLKPGSTLLVMVDPFNNQRMMNFCS